MLEGTRVHPESRGAPGSYRASRRSSREEYSRAGQRAGRGTRVLHGCVPGCTFPAIHLRLTAFGWWSALHHVWSEGALQAKRLCRDA